MKKLIVSLMVIVYMNSGKVIKYKEANEVRDDRQYAGLFDGGAPASFLIIGHRETLGCSWFCEYKDIDKLPIASVEHWEIKDNK